MFSKNIYSHLRNISLWVNLYDIIYFVFLKNHLTKTNAFASCFCLPKCLLLFLISVVQTNTLVCIYIYIYIYTQMYVCVLVCVYVGCVKDLISLLNQFQLNKFIFVNITIKYPILFWMRYMVREKEMKWWVD